MQAFSGLGMRPNSWLPGLSPEAITALAERARKRSFPRGQTIFRKGDPGDSMFLIVVGQVRIVLPSDDNEEAILAVLGPGECFGELSVIDGAPRSASVLSTEDTEVLVVDREQFLEVIAARPQFAIELLRILAGRLRDTDEAVEDAVFLDVQARLAKRLLALADDYGRPGPDGTEIRLRITQTDLAAMVGATRESVNKHMGAFRSRGVVTTQRGRIFIRRPEVLRRRIY